MAELIKVKKCYHCGEILQTEDPEKEGYISPDILDQYPDGLLLCDKCFKNEKFANLPKEASFNDEYETILNEIKRKNALVVYVVDLYSFEGAFINKIVKLLDGVDVLVVANKRDLLPESVNDDELKEYVAHRLRVTKFKVVDVCITSTSKGGHGITDMLHKLGEIANGRDVYFIGASVSGKSALIDEILKRINNETDKMIVTHTFEGTNLRGIRIPVDENTFIIETPGTSIDNSMLSKVEKVVQKDIAPKKAVKARKYNLSENSFLMFGGLACIELLSKEKTQVYAYASDKVEIKAKRGDSGKIFGQLLKKQSLKPSSENLTSLLDFDAYDFQVTEEGDRDIGILGLGWIKFTGNQQLFRIYVPKGVYVFTTRSKVKNVK